MGLEIDSFNSLPVWITEIFVLLILNSKITCLVQRESMQDQYGAFWTIVFFFALARVAFKMFSLNGARLFLSYEMVLALTFLVIVAIGVKISILLSRFSVEKRKSVQELALLRFDIMQQEIKESLVEQKI